MRVPAMGIQESGILPIHTVSLMVFPDLVMTIVLADQKTFDSIPADIYMPRS